MSRKIGIVLRVLAIILVASTAVFTILGSVGTVCIAFNAEQYGKAYAAFIPYKPTYQALVYAKMAVGIFGLAATLAMVRGNRWAYWGAVLAVMSSFGAAVVQMTYSSALRQIPFLAVAPTNIRFYVAAFTLVVLLLLRLPPIWQDANFTRPWRGGSGKPAAVGMAATIAGVILVSVPMWAAPNHVVDGFNYVTVLALPLMVGGGSLLLSGLALLALVGMGVSTREAVALCCQWLATTRQRARVG